MFEQLAVATRDVDDDQEMVSPAQIIGMFVDWTDPQKAMYVVCLREVENVCKMTCAVKYRVRRSTTGCILIWQRIFSRHCSRMIWKVRCAASRVAILMITVM